MIVLEDISRIFFIFTLFPVFGRMQMRNRADVSLVFSFYSPSTLVEGLEREGVYKGTTKRLHFVAGLYSTTTLLCIMRWAGLVWKKGRDCGVIVR